MANKMTKKDYFNKVLDYVKDNDELVNFINHEIELLEKKAGNKKPSKTQEENVGYKKEILAVLDDNKVTVTELQSKSEMLGQLSNQRVSALLRQLVESGEVMKTVDKKKSYFYKEVA